MTRRAPLAAALLAIVACRPGQPSPTAPRATAAAPPVARTSDQCSVPATVLPPTHGPLVPPGPPAGAEVLAIELVARTTPMITIDRGSFDGVRVGDRGWLIDDDGRAVPGS